MSEGYLYRDKYTKEQFKEKLENTYLKYAEYGFNLELKEDLEDGENPYYYELTKPDLYLEEFYFREDIILDYEDENYKCFEHDSGSITVEDENFYFCILANELVGYARERNRKMENVERQLQALKAENKKMREALESAKKDTQVAIEIYEDGKHSDVDMYMYVDSALETITQVLKELEE